MERSLIQKYLAYSLHTVKYDIPGDVYHGKVRDTYRTGDYLLLIASDRISAFDHIMRQPIPFKGQILNLLAAYFFEKTSDIIENHVIDIVDANATLALRCEALPIEFVVRGYLAGHAWRLYKSGKRSICGVPLPDGLKQNSRLPSPILTPATKAQEGHDEDISRREIIEKGIIDEALLDQLFAISLELFQRGTEMAKERNLLLVDTKYEFGIDSTGKVRLIDEIHTPDSSRYFYKEPYEMLLSEDLPQKQLSKEFLREWLIANNFQGLDGQTLPDLPDSLRIEITQRYAELFAIITGIPFTPQLDTTPQHRIEQAVRSSPFFQKVNHI